MAAMAAGCGGEGSKEVPSPGAGGSMSTRSPGVRRQVMFVGFDISPRLIEAIEAKKLHGTVVQDPYRMGQESVRTLAAHLEKQPVEKKISTGETLVTPENLGDAAIRKLINPPKAGNTEDTSSSAAKTKKYRFMVIPKGTTHEHWKAIHAGAKKAAEDLGTVEILWQGPQKEDERSEQIKLVETAIAVGVDGIVIAPLDAKALVEPIEQAIAKGIPVVVMDSGLESTKTVSYVATDNYRGGVLAAQRLGGLLNGKGRIILLRYAEGSESTMQREKGFTDTMKKEFPEIIYLSDNQYAGPTSDSAQRKAETLITQFREQVDGVFCPNESSTLGMLRVLDGAGLLPE
jgi:ribose transport system substrate-binding protein